MRQRKNRWSFIVLLAAVFAASNASAQGSWTRLGPGCPHGFVRCIEHNSNLSINTLRPPSGNWIFIRATAPSNMNVSGFSLRLRSLSGGPVRVRTAIHAETGTSPVLTPLAEGTTVEVTTTADWVRTFFPQRSFQAGQRFYLAVENPPSGISIGATASSAGTNARWFTRSLTGGALSAAMSEKWAYRVHCDGATPNIQGIGSPSLGQTFTIRCDNVPVGQTAVLFIGGAPPTPISLASVGAGGCYFEVSNPFALSVIRNGGPQNTVNYPFAIPNFPLFRGLTIRFQWAVTAPGTNPASWVVSNPAQMVIG